jgi:putative hydrolase of the HAD superfamily
MDHGIEAILFDFGGVITSSPFEAFNRYEAEHGLPRDFIRSVNARNGDTNAWARMERAEIDGAEFDQAFRAESQALGHAISGSDVLGLLSGDIRPVMVDALKLCASRFKIGCLTNNVRSGSGPGMARDGAKAKAVADVMALFQVVIESSKVGLRKPDPKIYLLACQQLGVAPQNTIYLDDLGINLKPAKELGMRTIKVGDPGPALAELAKMTGLVFAGV